MKRLTTMRCPRHANCYLCSKLSQRGGSRFVNCCLDAEIMKRFLIPCLGLLSTVWMAALTRADGPHQHHDVHGNHSRYHDDLDHRDYHRDLDHREAHRYPMTSGQHGRLHDSLEHEAFHDRLEHRSYHRGPAYSYGPQYGQFPRYSVPQSYHSGHSGYSGRQYYYQHSGPAFYPPRRGVQIYIGR